MGASRRARRAIERAEIKVAAKQVRAYRRQAAAEAEQIHDEALRMAATFDEPSGLVNANGHPLYVLADEVRGDGE